MRLAAGRIPLALLLASLLACAAGSEPSPEPEPPSGFAGVRIQQGGLAFNFPGEARRVDAYAVDTAGHPMPGVRVALRIRNEAVIRLGLDGQFRARQPGDSWIVAEAFGETDSILTHFATDRPVWRIPVLVDVLDAKNPVYQPFDSIPARMERLFDFVNHEFRTATTDGSLYFEILEVREIDDVSMPPSRWKDPPSLRAVFDPNALIRSGWYAADRAAVLGGTFPDGPLGIWAAQTMVHELGHGRGAVDLYAQEVQVPENNTVTGAVYRAPPGIMSTMSGGWDPHSRFLINRNTTVLDAPLGGNLGEFPPELVVHVRDDSGTPLAGVDMAIYPVAWYGWYVPNASIRTGSTDLAGDWRVSGDVFDLHWANLHVVGRTGNDVYIGWLPYVDVQGQFFTAPADLYEITLVRQSEAGLTRTVPPPSPSRSVQERWPQRFRPAETSGENRLSRSY